MLDDGNNTSIGALSQTLEGKKSLAHTKTKVIKNTELAWNNHIYPSAATKYSSQHDHFQPSRQLRTATHSDYSVYSTTPFTTVSMPHSYSFHSENCHYLSYVPKQKKTIAALYTAYAFPAPTIRINKIIKTPHKRH